MTAPTAFVDCETDGVHHGRRPWEIAIIRREPDGSETTCHVQVEDVDLSNANLFGLRVGGFYTRHWSVGGDPRPAAVWREAEVAVLVEKYTRDAHLVGAVPNFDAEVFADMLRRHRLTPAWHFHLIDVEALAIGYLHGRRVAESADAEWSNAIADVGIPWKSDELSRACGVEPPGEQERHTALGDALWVQRWYDAIVRDPAARPAVAP